MESKVESYRIKYLKEYDACQECYRNGDYRGWGAHGNSFLDKMCTCLVFILSEDESMAVDILKGHRDFKHLYSEKAKMHPIGPRLIGLMYQGNNNRFGNIDFHRLCDAYTELRKMAKSVPTTKTETVWIYQILKDAEETARQLLETGKPSEDLPSLESVLDQCGQAAKEGHTAAKKYLSVVKDALQEADGIIISCKTEIDELHPAESFSEEGPSFADTIKSQMETLRGDFWRTFNDCTSNLRIKAKETARFNITVFGVTQAGKSTLMSILTKGNEDAIGKGGQRTTLKPQSYEWNGLTIVDVPGIGAVQGQEDSELAEAEAVYADLILFLINSDSPTDEEAEWLVRLKRKDKPILCIINFHESIAAEMDMDIFLQNPGYYIKSSKMEEVKTQFLEFVHKRIPNEHIDILVSHFLARKMADDPDRSEYRERLLKASNFDEVEKGIIRTVIRGGVLYRKKCFLSIIDNPLYDQMEGMITFYRQTKGLHDLTFKKKTEFDSWKQSFMSGLGIKVESLVNGCFDTVKAKIPAFVDAHLEERRFNKQLNDFLDSEEISKKVTQKRDALIRKAYQDVGNFFSDLEKEGQFTMGWMNLPERGVRIVNWKKIIKWGGIALGIVASIVTEGAWPLILLPISELLDRISERIRTKRARKAEYKAEKVASIIRHLDGQRNKMSKKLIADLDNNLTNGLLKEAGRRFYALKISIEALLNGQRHLVDRYNRCHLEVSRKIITNILDSLGYGPEDYATLQVARIPGKWTVLVPGDDRIWTRSGESNSKSLPARTISSLLGNQERVTVLWLDTSLPKTSQARFLLHYMFGRGCWFCSLNDEYGYMYVDRTLTGEQYLDRINIIEQLLNVLILPNDKYYGKD